MDVLIKSTAALSEVEINNLGNLVSDSELMQKYGTNFEHIKSTWSNPDPNDRFYIAINRENQSSVGFAWLKLKAAFGRSPYLKLLLVDKSVHGIGIGKQLMHEIEIDFLQMAGLFVLANSNNHNANAFYQKLGYQSVGVLKNYVLTGQDEIIFWKSKKAP